MQISFEIILCACVCISSQAIVTQEGSVTGFSVHISMRICTKTLVLKLFPFQVSESVAKVDRNTDEDVQGYDEISVNENDYQIDYEVEEDINDEVRGYE